MVIFIALFVIIGLAMIGYTVVRYNQHRVYSFKSAELRRQQSIQLLIGVGGVVCLILAWLLGKV